MTRRGTKGFFGGGGSLPSRLRSAVSAVTGVGALATCLLTVSLLVAGCSGSRPEAARTYPPAQPPPDCACTLELRMNLCVTVDGSSALPESSTFVREREDGSRDTLRSGTRCFGEWRGLQRILREDNARLVDSTGWFEIRTVDCCHGEAKTVDFNTSY